MGVHQSHQLQEAPPHQNEPLHTQDTTEYLLGPGLENLAISSDPESNDAPLAATIPSPRDLVSSEEVVAPPDSPESVQGVLSWFLIYFGCY